MVTELFEKVRQLYNHIHVFSEKFKSEIYQQKYDNYQFCNSINLLESAVISGIEPRNGRLPLMSKK